MKTRLSYSTAKKLLRMLPEQAMYSIDNPTEPTDAMLLGTRVEVAFHEGLDVLRVYPGKVRRGKEWEKFKADNADFHIVNKTEYDKICGIVYSLEKQAPWLKEMNYQSHLVSKLGDLEVHGYSDWDNENCIFDLKITDSSEREFMRSIGRFDYHIQAAVYNYCTGKKFFWVCAHPEMPHPVRVYQASEAMIEVGMNDLRKAAELFLKYRDNTLIPDDMQPIEVEPPNWMIERSQYE